MGDPCHCPSAPPGRAAVPVGAPPGEKKGVLALIVAVGFAMQVVDRARSRRPVRSEPAEPVRSEPAEPVRSEPAEPAPATLEPRQERDDRALAA